MMNRKYFYCQVVNCTNTHRANGYCHRHNTTYKKYGYIPNDLILHRFIKPKKLFEQNCVYCNKTTVDYPSRIKKFCSNTCKGAFKKGKQDLNLTYKIPKGNIPWNKGVKGFIAKELHWNWKGGITDINDTIRHSLDYRIWRKSVFERDDYTCQNCGQVGGNLEADHIKQFAHFPELRFDINNGRTLCKDCHRKTPTYGNKGKVNA